MIDPSRVDTILIYNMRDSIVDIRDDREDKTGQTFISHQVIPDHPFTDA
jgi:hypothetical protein